MASELADRLAQDFAGAWIDQADGGRIAVGLVGDDPASKRVVLEAAAKRQLETLIKFEPARYGWTRLIAIYKAVAADLARANVGSSKQLSVAVAQDTNSVKLLVPEIVTATQAQYLATWHIRYGGAVVETVRPGNTTLMRCDPPYCDKPLRGGVRIDPNGNTVAGSCTAGFNAKSRINDVYYLITAGHCVDGRENVGWFTKQYSTGRFHLIGSTHNHIFGETGDMAILKVNDASGATGWAVKPWVWVQAYYGSPSTEPKEDYLIRATSQVMQNIYLCKTGATTGTSCGPLTDWGFSNGVVNGLARVEANACEGDSGAPVYARNAAYGILSAGGDPGTCASSFLYQGVREIEQLMNVNVLIG